MTMLNIKIGISARALNAAIPLLALVLGGGLALAQPARPQSAQAIAADAVKWMPAPDAFPAGAEIAVMMGDSSEPGPFVVRLRFPAGFVFPAHKHSVDELVTVLSGTVHFGHGNAVDKTNGQPLGALGFNPLLANRSHYLWTDDGATIQVHGTGPFDLTYVDPKDDRRGK